MDYERLYTVNKNRYINCLNSMIFATSFITSIFSFLTFEYIKHMADGLENSNLQEVVNTFAELKECIEKSHICG